ncbi:hypothetical protein AB6T38_11050 [Aliiglaciecola sp. SL4]|uniref:hypothetical protein n=1 Tax=Aliiglaciecola sp. SL4 TaxID=3239806 RepID=UPI00355AE296
MPYCHTVFQQIALDEVESLLSTFTIENFVGGRAAYHLGNGSYSIDAGENDIRAIYEGEVVRFFCRHEKEMLRYEKKLKVFATKHGIKLSTSS